MVRYYTRVYAPAHRPLYTQSPALPRVLVHMAIVWAQQSLRSPEDTVTNTLCTGERLVKDSKPTFSQWARNGSLQYQTASRNLGIFKQYAGWNLWHWSF